MSDTFAKLSNQIEKYDLNNCIGEITQDLWKILSKIVSLPDESLNKELASWSDSYRAAFVSNLDYYSSVKNPDTYWDMTSYDTWKHTDAYRFTWYFYMCVTH